MRRRTLSVVKCGLAAVLVASEAGAQRSPGPSGSPDIARPHGDVPIEVEIESRDGYTTPPARRHVVRARNRADKAVVSYGLQLFHRDQDARLHPVRVFLVRPRYAFAPRQVHPVPLPLAGESPEYELRATFALFADGTWAGDAGEARREVASLREEYAAAREMGEVLSAVPPRPSREDIARVLADFARRRARATARRARQQYEVALRTLGAVLDERTRAGRTYEEVLSIVRGKVDRMLAECERLAFVTRSVIRG